MCIINILLSTSQTGIQRILFNGICKINHSNLNTNSIYSINLNSMLYFFSLFNWERFVVIK